MIALLGLRGYGKTTTAKRLARDFQASDAGARVLVLDPHEAYEPADVGADAIVTEDLEVVADVVQLEQFRVIYRPAFDEDDEEAFDLICRLLFHLKSALVVVDEAEEWYQPSNVPLSFKKAVARSRANGLSMVLCGHRAVELPTKFRALCEFWVFRTRWRGDLDFYADKASEAQLERIPHLKKGEYVRLSPEDDEGDGGERRDAA